MENSPALSHVVEQYLDHRGTRYSAATVKNEGDVLRRFVANLANPRVARVTPEMVEDWFS